AHPRHRRLLRRSLPATLTTREVAIFAPNARLGLHSDSLRELGLRCRLARVRAGRPWTGYLHPAIQAALPRGVQRPPWLATRTDTGEHTLRSRAPWPHRGKPVGVRRLRRAGIQPRSAHPVHELVLAHIRRVGFSC